MPNFKERITTAVETAILSRVNNSSVFNEYYKRTDSSKRVDYTKLATSYNEKTIKDWTLAVMMATDPLNPRRGNLMRFFESIKLDLHLCSCVDNRILPIQCAPFKLTDKSGTEDIEAHKLLEKPWYIDLVRLICLNIYEGTKLIEMIDVNDKGELAQVTEIPQSNFLPDKGIIIKEEYDTQGFIYKDGAYKDYYIQIGNDYNLGLFNQVAMIVLAKKLGLGSWMAYIDKFGIPPVFAITDRMDQKRIDELFDMLVNFRSNHFAVLQGKEKIEVPNNYGTDGYQSFKALNEHCDDAMSKFFQGGTGTSDAKSFVGSAEVHERLLKYRHQVDKLLLKFYMNEEIIPRLIKLSSVYAPLANLYYEFDEAETMTLAEKIKAVVELSKYYKFDVEELAKITGLPVTEVREAIAADSTPTPDPQKKKPNASVAGASFSNLPFQGEYPQGEGFKVGAGYRFGVRSATWDAAIERLASQIYNGEVKPSDLDKDLVLKNYASLSKAAESAWGKGYYDEELTRQFRENLLKFSGAKSNNLMQHLNDLKRSVSDKETFITEAKKLVNLHNETYMNVESKFVANKTSTAKDFIQFNADIDIYPNLKVRTMQDENVRESHAANEGVVMPVNKCTHTPPFDPGCRCWLEQTTDEVTKHGLTNINAKWATNAYTTGTLISDQHSYFESITGKSIQIVRQNTELMKQFSPYNKAIDTKSGNKVLVNDFAHVADMSQNIAVAKKIADELGKDMYIRHHIEGGIVQNHKNPELGIGSPNNLGDLKTYLGESKFDNFMQNNIKSADKQGANTVVLDVSTAQFTNEYIKRRLSGSLSGDRNSSIERVIIIKGSKVAQITRKQIVGKDFESFLNKLKQKADGK